MLYLLFLIIYYNLTLISIFLYIFHSPQELVSSSTENMSAQPRLTAEKATRSRRRRGSSAATQQLDRPYSDSVEKLRRVLESIVDKDELMKMALDTMQQELDRSQSVQAEHLRAMVDAHNQHVSEIKKKQWVRYRLSATVFTFIYFLLTA